MKVLCFGLNWVGDVVMSYGALANAAIGAGQPVDVVTRPHLSPLYKLHPGVGKVWAVDTKAPFWRSLPAILRWRRTGYDMVIVLPRSFRAAWLAFLTGGKMRVGYAGEGRSPLLTLALPLPTRYEHRHESRLHAHLVAAAGLPDFSAPLPSIKSDPGRVEAVRQRFGLAADEDFFVVAPGAAFGEAKRWPAERFAETALRLTQLLGWRAVATGTAAETGLTATVVSGLGSQGIDLGGRTSLEELILLLSRARLVLANDSGTMHLAALVKVPVAVPVGSTDMRRTGPLTDRAALVQTDACRQMCRRSVCPRGTNACLTSIGVDQMMEAVIGLLGRVRGSARPEGASSHG